MWPRDDEVDAKTGRRCARLTVSVVRRSGGGPSVSETAGIECYSPPVHESPGAARIRVLEGDAELQPKSPKVIMSILRMNGMGSYTVDIHSQPPGSDKRSRSPKVVNRPGASE